MKNRFSFLVSAALLLSVLTGCEHFVPGGDGSGRPVIDSTGEPTEGPTEGDTGDNDGFTVFSEGNYLADPMFDTDEFLPEYDADISFIQHGSTEQRGLCVTEDTIYFYWDEHLLFTDKDTGITLPLCGKPECTHTDNSCNAYIGGEAAGLRVYDGKLYWIEDGQNVMRMGLDGTAHERVTSLDPSLRTQISGDSTWVIHRGYVYLAGARDAVMDGERKSVFTVYAKPLDSGDGFTVMSAVRNGSGSYCAMRPVGNDLYIVTNSTEYEDWETREGPAEILDFYRWDSKTRKAERLYSQDGNTPEGVGFYAGCFPLPVPGDGVYFCDVVESEDDALAARIMKLSFDTGTVEETGSFPVPETWPRFTADHVIVSTLSENSFLRFYDYSGELLFECGPLDAAPGAMLMGEDERYVYYKHVEGFLAISKSGGTVLAIK